MKVYVVEHSYENQDAWCPVSGREPIHLRMSIARWLLWVLRAEQREKVGDARGKKYRISTYVRLDPKKRTKPRKDRP